MIHKSRGIRVLLLSTKGRRRKPPLWQQDSSSDERDKIFGLETIERAGNQKEITAWASLFYASYASSAETSIKSAPPCKSAVISLCLQQQRQRTVHGEELPYVLGVPLDGSKYDLRGRYDMRETLFSEAIMNWWCSFAYIGWVIKSAPTRVRNSRAYNLSVRVKSFLKTGFLLWSSVLSLLPFSFRWTGQDGANECRINNCYALLRG